jgi:hypothetical protein
LGFETIKKWGFGRFEFKGYKKPFKVVVPVTKTLNTRPHGNEKIGFNPL